MAFADATPKAPAIKTDIVIRDGENAAKITFYDTSCQEAVEFFAQSLYDDIPWYKANNELPEFTVKARGKKEDDDDKDEE